MALKYLHEEFPPIDREEFLKIQKEAPKHKITKDFVRPQNKH
jgi:hypothetical protein